MMFARIRPHALSLFFALIFALALIGQSIAGFYAFNDEQSSHGEAMVSFTGFVTSSDFVVDVAENWQSEYLQFFLYVFGTVWLLQHGSPESKELDKAGVESDREQKVGDHADPSSPRWAADKGWRQTLYSRSLGIVMAVIFTWSWLAQSIAGVAAYNEEHLRQLQAPVSWPQYLGSADFWNRTLQNWQSELLAVASMAILSVYLRQRGSPESKPVGSAHTSTGVEG